MLKYYDVSDGTEVEVTKTVRYSVDHNMSTGGEWVQNALFLEGVTAFPVHSTQMLIIQKCTVS